MRKKTILKKTMSCLLSAVLVAGAVLLGGCGSSSADSQTGAATGESKQSEVTAVASAHDTLAVAVSSAPITVDASNISDNASWIVAYNLYTPLLVPSETQVDGVAYGDKGNPTTEGGLVDSYTVDDTQTVYTFTLKSGIKFNTGTELTSQAVIDTLDYTNGGFLYSVSGIQSYEAVDDLTFTITLGEPNAFFLSACTSIFPIDFSAIPDGEEPATWLGSNAAGVGAYNLDTWDPSSAIVLSANADYFAGAPVFQKIVIQYVPEASNHTLLLQSGDIDLSTAVQTKDLAGLDSGATKVTEAASNRIAYLTLNSQVAPFDNADLRKAVMYAIPYDSLVNDVMDAHASKMISAVPYTLTGAVDSQAYEYNLEKAKEYLTAAGYPDGFEFTFTLCSGYSDYSDSAVLIQSELAKIGIKMNIQTVEYSEFTEILKGGEEQAFINSWTPFVPHIMYHINSLFKSSGMFNRYACIKDSTVDSLLEGINSLPEEEYNTRLEEIQKEITDYACWGYLYQYNNAVVSNTSLQGTLIYSDSVPRLYKLSWAE